MSGTASDLTTLNGRTLEFATAVLRQLPRDIPPELALQWINDQAGLQAALRVALILSNGQSAVTPPLPPTTYPVAVNYGQALKVMVKAGKFDWVNDNVVQKNFPHDKGRGVEEVSIELVKYDRSMESDEVDADFEAKGLRSATLEEICAFAAKYPDVQRQFPVVALGSPWVDPDHGRYVPYLGLWAHGWLAHCRFAGVRK